MKFLLEMIKFKTLFVVASLFILTPITLAAQSDEDLLKRPSPQRLVNDEANVIDDAAEAQLENKLVHLILLMNIANQTCNKLMDAIK